MTDYREIIRLSGLGLSQINIALSCNASKTTVNKVLFKNSRKCRNAFALAPACTTVMFCEDKGIYDGFKLGLAAIAASSSFSFTLSNSEIKCCKSIPSDMPSIRIALSAKNNSADSIERYCYKN